MDSDLNHVVAHGPDELNVREKPRVVAGAEADLNEPLPVSEDKELRERHVRGHLH